VSRPPGNERWEPLDERAPLVAALHRQYAAEVAEWEPAPCPEPETVVIDIPDDADREFADHVMRKHRWFR
jgi:hypothetical protein